MARQEGVRKALLIGAPKYDLLDADLPVVKKDLRVLHEALVSSGYHVGQLGADDAYAATRSRIRQKIRQFFAGATEEDMLLLYFSGHGVSLNKKDYLVPSDASFDDRDAVEEYLIPVDMSDLISKCKAQTVLFFIDACRRGIHLLDPSRPEDTPFQEWSEGEHRPVGEHEYLIMFSCGPGQVSRSDEHNQASYFTEALAEVLDAKHPAQTLGDVSKALQERLNALTSKQEQPRQTIRVHAHSDPSLRLLEREICRGPKSDEDHARKIHTNDKIDTHQAIPAKSYCVASDGIGHSQIAC